MSETSTQWPKLILFLVFIAFFWWGVTYIPVVRDWLPDIVQVSSTTRFDIEDADPNSDYLPSEWVDNACHNVPFLMRPLAGGKAFEAKMIFTYHDEDMGEMVVNCHTGEKISERQY